MIKKIENFIYLIRGHKVILDSDLATLYGVPTKRLNEQVQRNIRRFPPDFMFRLTLLEAQTSRSQNATLNAARGQNIKYLPFAFTEQGVAMLSSVFNSPKAIQVNIQIMRAFVKLRQMMASNAELSKKIEALEKKYDGQFQVVFEAIRQLMAPPETKKRRIGIITENKEKGGGHVSRNIGVR